MMKTYIGTKIIQAKPCMRYDDLNKPGRNGYHVVYPDGYESWSPKDVFEAAYRPMTAMNFAIAIEAMKLGKKVSRAQWEIDGVVAYISADSKGKPRAYLQCFDADKQGAFAKTVIRFARWFVSRCPWTPKASDLMAEDWRIVE